jgi:hypothetical protein
LFDDVVRMHSRICRFVSPLPASSAATPDTYGEAIDVPANVS